MAQILVTGASGVLGRRVVSRLIHSGADVRRLSRHPDRDAQAGLSVQGDLVHNAGLEAALSGIDTIVHCASSGAAEPQVDMTAMRNLLDATRHAGVQHFVFISIVGIDQLTWFPYYETKLACERLLIESGIPWTLQRATQFHELAAHFLALMVRGPLMIVPAGGMLQPVEVGAVADRLSGVALTSPGGRLVDLAGPEVRSFNSLARSWRHATGSHKVILPLPLNNLYFRLLRSNRLFTPECERIGINWEQWLKTPEAAIRPYATGA